VCTEARSRLNKGNQPLRSATLVRSAPNRRDNVVLGTRYAELEGYLHGFTSGKRFSHQRRSMILLNDKRALKSRKLALGIVSESAILTSQKAK